jgi:hypothetical protein
LRGGRIQIAWTAGVGTLTCTHTQFHALKNCEFRADVSLMRSGGNRSVFALFSFSFSFHGLFFQGLLQGILLAGLTLVPLRAQEADSSAQKSRILALEHAWNQAEAFNDLKALDAIFDNALVYVDSDGTLMTKAEFLSRVKSAHLQQVVTQSMSVQMFGSAAIVTGTYQASEFKNGKTIIHRGRFVDTWVYQNSNWTCVAAQATPLMR